MCLRAKKQRHEYNSKVLHHGSHLKEKIKQKTFVFLDLQNSSQIVRKIDENNQRKKKGEKNHSFFDLKTKLEV